MHEKMPDKKKNKYSNPFRHFHSWGESTNSLWLASTLSLHRNVDKFHFPHKLDSHKRDSVSELIVKSAESFSDFSQREGIKIHFDEITPFQREYFSEHFLIFREMVEGNKGRIVMTNGSGDIALKVNFSDHIQLHAIDIKGELEKTLERLVALEHHIEKKLPFAFSDKFGYLTSDPTACGTALTVRAYVHIPALILLENFLEIKDVDKQEIVSLTGLQGSPSDLIGDIVVVSNTWTLGVTEEMILSSVRTEVLKLVAQETAARNRIKNDKEPYVLDRIGRAIGVLKHSYSIDTSESLRELSMIKFGIELGWITGISEQEVNRLLLLCRRAHLVESLSTSLPEKEFHSEFLYKARAEMLRASAAPISLLKDI